MSKSAPPLLPQSPAFQLDEAELAKLQLRQKYIAPLAAAYRPTLNQTADVAAKLGIAMVIDINEPRYLHLNPLSRPIAALADEERRRLICRDRWIGYTAATQALAKFEELLTYPQKQRMPNLLLIGSTNNGKSKIIRRFLDITDPRIQPEGKVMDRPATHASLIAEDVQAVRF